MGMFQQGIGGVGLSPHIANLRPLHRSMARAVALGTKSPMQLSQAYGYTPGQISRIMGSPVFQAEVQRLERELEIVSFDYAKDLKLMGERAMQNIDEDLHMPTDTLDHRKLRNQTSLEVLGMIGVRKSGGMGGITNILNINDNRTMKEVNALDESEIRDEVMNLLEGKDGTYE